tara:strand:- start:7010 stop:7348 length:339 start_codon:yes stop_codon:yes gene_type:complete
MRDIYRGIGIFLVAIIVMAGIGFGAGWLNVGYTQTVGKSQQNADRVVFEETNSFTKGKRQEIIKYYKEWQSAETLQEKKAIETIVSMSLADFDEDRFITDARLLSWIKDVKY